MGINNNAEQQFVTSSVIDHYRSLENAFGLKWQSEAAKWDKTRRFGVQTPEYLLLSATYVALIALTIGTSHIHSPKWTMADSVSMTVQVLLLGLSALGTILLALHSNYNIRKAILITTYAAELCQLYEKESIETPYTEHVDLSLGSMDKWRSFAFYRDLEKTLDDYSAQTDKLLREFNSIRFGLQTAAGVMILSFVTILYSTIVWSSSWTSLQWTLNSLDIFFGAGTLAVTTHLIRYVYGCRLIVQASTDRLFILRQKYADHPEYATYHINWSKCT